MFLYPWFVIYFIIQVVCYAKRLDELVEDEQKDLILARVPDLINSRLDASMRFEYTFIVQALDGLASAIPTQYD